jgi:hypothetical protein
VAKVWLAGTAEMARDSAKPLPPAATGCGLDRMVRRGSTVRVRQRALKSPEIGIFVVSIDMKEHLPITEGVDGRKWPPERASPA